MSENANKVFDSIYKIERSLTRLEPILRRWSGFYMAKVDKWYFAYTIDDDTITIDDACHEQDMFDE